METLALGPKNAVLEKKNLNKNDVLCELNGLFKHYRGNEVSEEQITDIDVKTLTYIRTARNKSHLATSS